MSTLGTFNIYTCPSCKNEHETASTYSSTICQQCMELYPPKTKSGEKIQFLCIHDKIYSFNGLLYSENIECFVDGKNCYPVIQFNTLFIVATQNIPKKIRYLNK